MSNNYPEKLDRICELMAELRHEIPGTIGAFSHHHEVSAEDSVLDGKVKELIALGIAITIRCEGCITFHVHDAIQAGASHEEITETIGVAILMGGGPSVVYGCEALEALSQFEAVPA